MRRGVLPVLVAALAACLSLLAPASSSAQASVPFPLHVDFSKGQIVPVPADIPHNEGAMVDDRIIPDLRYLAGKYHLYVVEGYAGYLHGYGQVGCRKCHVSDSDHFRGLATDLIPLNWDGHGCDRSWRPVTRLAKWAEPRQNYPRLPFRWVGYNGDVDHGCGNHLHLSWTYAPTKKFHVADWVQVFDPPSTGDTTSTGTPQTGGAQTERERVER
jgi:hypothetical protein